MWIDFAAEAQAGEFEMIQYRKVVSQGSRRWCPVRPTPYLASLQLSLRMVTADHHGCFGMLGTDEHSRGLPIQRTGAVQHNTFSNNASDLLPLQNTGDLTEQLESPFLQAGDAIRGRH